MNIRENLINATDNKDTNFIWHENPIIKLETKSNESEIFLGLTKEPLIFLNDLKLDNRELNLDFLIFASRHTSKTARPAFLVHTTGNWGKDAEFGGEPQSLSLSSALLLKAGFISFIKTELFTPLSDFSVDIEVTHHGPTSLEIPLIFMELGSSKREWKIAAAGKTVASVILDTINRYTEYKNLKNQKIGLGFGGTHYCPNFHRLIQNNDIAISFICPKYYIQDLNNKMISYMIQNTSEKIDFFMIDWKGTNSADKNHLIPLLEEFDIPIKKTKDF
ncbi:MAG: D-aminoacyl-tRNA deacylase [Candidatus Thorarchaeota archaeon]